MSEGGYHMSLKHTGGSVKITNSLKTGNLQKTLVPAIWDSGKVATSHITYIDERNVSGIDNGNGEVGALSTAAVTSGKYYWEVEVVTAGNGEFGVGISQSTDTSYTIHQWKGTGTGLRWLQGGITSYNVKFEDTSTGVQIAGSGTTNGDIIHCALDVDNRYFYVGRNGTWANGASLADIENGVGTNHVSAQLPSGQSWTAMVRNGPVLVNGDTWQVEANFGQDPFTYSVPAGFAEGIGVYDYIFNLRG